MPQDYQHVQQNNNNDSSFITIDQAIEELGTGKFQLRLLIAAGLCFAADAMQVILLSFLTLVIQDEWELSNGLTAAITSFLFAGSLIGTLMLGPMADRLGRRPIFLLSALIITVFGIGTAMAPNYFFLVAMIFLVGIGIGGLTVPFDVLAEFLPANHRGTNLLLIEYFWTGGCLYVVVVAYQTLHNNDQWRLFVVLCGLPCLVSLIVGIYWVPESSRWLVSQGRTQEALDILREAAIMNGKDPFEVYPSECQIIHEEEKEASFEVLFTPKWRGTMLRMWGAWGAFAFGYYGVILATTKVFEKSDDEDDRLLEKTDFQFDFGAIFVSSSAELVGTTLVILLVDKVGRIPSQVWCYALAGMSVFALCLFDSWSASRSVLIALAFAARVFEMGGTCVTWVSTAEILTTEVRSTGHSTANAVARLGAIFSPIVVDGKAPILHIGIIMLIVHTFTAICISQLPETKGAAMGSARDSDPSERSEGVFLVEQSRESIDNNDETRELS